MTKDQLMRDVIDAWDACGRYPDTSADIERLDTAFTALRAALQDKAEVRDARFWLEAIVDIWNDGDKAPEHRCYVEGALSDAMREASALLAAQPAPVVPEMSSIAIRKLGGLQERGYQINGYAIRRGNERGLIDSSGFVGWWRSEIAPVVPEPLIVKGAMAGMVDAQVRDLWPTNGAALAASQQKGGV